MGISVIIPVYNSEQWIGQSVTSALNFDVISEVLIIDDGSTDNSSKLLRELASSDKRITILSHPNNQNKGRSASRNLGIQAATQPWVAFLDADDYFLSNRFDDIDLGSQVDGYYGSISSHNERNIEASGLVTGIRQDVKPELLYQFLTEQPNEYFSIVGLTIRREKLLESGLFDEGLDVGEDTDLIWRLSKLIKLHPQNTKEAIAIRRVHQSNYQRETSDRAAFYYKWLTEPPYPLSERAQKRVFYAYQKYNSSKDNSKLYERFRYIRWKLSGKRLV